MNLLMALMSDKTKVKTKWIIRKFADERAYKQNEPFEVNEVEGNVFLNEGIDEIWRLVCGDAGATDFSNSNAYLGVGDGTTAEDATQTGLLGTNVTYKAVDTGYPTYGSNQKATWKATFSGTEANHAWQEFTVANGSDNSAINLNRKVSDQGTKISGQIWELTLELSIS